MAPITRWSEHPDSPPLNRRSVFSELGIHCCRRKDTDHNVDPEISA
jgi:hypothetical protein